jgi:RNA-directed DNA polymerase
VNWTPNVVRYADDFVVLHEDRAVIAQVQQIVAEWLAGMGLELKPSKTRIVHTLVTGEHAPGFDFLGFNVRQYPVGKTHTAHTTNGRPLGFKAIIKPSAESIRTHTQRIGEIIARHQATPQDALIANLTPVVRGWTRYFSTVAAGRTFGKLRCVMYQKLRRWALRRHPNKSPGWVVRKYWRLETGKWDFAVKDGPRLYWHSQTPIRRHVKVEGPRSAFDGDWVYWGSRLGHHPELPRRVARLLQWQKGRCAACGLYFTVDDLSEVDHIIPKAMGGRDGYINWQLIHRHCHDSKTAKDGSRSPLPSEVPMTRAKDVNPRKPSRGVK